MTIINKFLLLISFLVLSVNLFSQEGHYQKGRNGQRGQKQMSGQIRGIILDSISNKPVEYATVALFHKNNNKIANIAITLNDGSFLLEKISSGRYFIKVTFMGFKEKIISDIKINKKENILNLHSINLQPDLQVLEEVVIDGSAPRIDYKIDKKVINVGKQIASLSGTAVDVLENVPSVKVDIEGNVSLRGSSGFTVLIDGRPSILDANDALLQIPASTIDNIEIITNPSAKYDPDGTAGIINVITKKNKLQGFSGITNLNIGINSKYGGDVLLNYKKSKMNIYFGIDYNARNYPGERYSERQTFVDNTTYKIIMNGTSSRERIRGGVRTGFDYSFSKNDVLGVGFRYGDREMSGNSKLDYDEWTDSENIHNLYQNNDETNRGGSFYSLKSNYLHKFKNKGHNVKLEFSYSNRYFEDNSINELTNDLGFVVDGKKNVENGPSNRIRAKVDYTLPIGEKNKFEAGFQTRFSNSEDKTELHILDVNSLIYQIQPEYSNLTIYKRNIHALYTIYAGEINNLGYQGGLRGEYTYRNIESGSNSDIINIDRLDLFPTLHFSYQLPKDHQLMASYARRIQRSRGWYLEPFITWVDAFNVRQGNPDLLPEYIDSYELGYLKKIGRSQMISLEGYYRITDNKVERVRSVFQENVMLSNPENVGKDYSLGLEFMFSSNLFKWWEVDLMGDFHKYKVEGVLYGVDFSNISNNWSSRFNNTFIISKNTKIQINSMYNGPSARAQGKSAGYYMVNAAVRQSFLDRKLSLVLQVRDIFSSAKHEFTSEGPDFYNYSEYRREAPIVTLTMSYRFNNYKPDRKSRSNGGDDGEMEEL